MKNRKPAQTNAWRDISEAILAKNFLDVQRLRDEVLKAELAAIAKRRSRLAIRKATGIKQRRAS